MFEREQSTVPSGETPFPLPPGTASVPTRLFHTFHLRPAGLSDVSPMGSVAASSYLSNTIARLLAPHRYTYLNEHVDNFSSRILERMLNPNNTSIVAIDSSTSHVIGCIQFVRINPPPQHFSIFVAFGWIRRLYMRAVWWWTKPRQDRSRDPQTMESFIISAARDAETHWGAKAYASRYHVQSLTISPDWQRRGMGAALMEEVLSKAKQEAVPIGLEASPVGEKLYRKMGFRKLADFDPVFEEIVPNLLEEGGGLYVWEPTGFR
jgi:ribosomal protein S18 acetylase RimI-like enzyme